MIEKTTDQRDLRRPCFVLVVLPPSAHINHPPMPTSNCTAPVCRLLSQHAHLIMDRGSLLVTTSTDFKKKEKRNKPKYHICNPNRERQRSLPHTTLLQYTHTHKKKNQSYVKGVNEFVSQCIGHPADRGNQISVGAKHDPPLFRIVEATAPPAFAHFLAGSTDHAAGQDSTTSMLFQRHNRLSNPSAKYQELPIVPGSSLMLTLFAVLATLSPASGFQQCPGNRLTSTVDRNRRSSHALNLIIILRLLWRRWRGDCFRCRCRRPRRAAECVSINRRGGSVTAFVHVTVGVLLVALAFERRSECGLGGLLFGSLTSE